MNEYNVQGTKDQLAAMREKFPTLTVVERFSPGDMNVKIGGQESDEDALVEYCEENGITCQLQ